MLVIDLSFGLSNFERLFFVPREYHRDKEPPKGVLNNALYQSQSSSANKAKEKIIKRSDILSGLSYLLSAILAFFADVEQQTYLGHQALDNVSMGVLSLFSGSLAAVKDASASARSTT